MSSPASTSASQRRYRIGIVSVEFFDLKAGQMGGFGWATQQLANFFQSRPELGVDIVFIPATPYNGQGEPPATLHGVRVIWRRGGAWRSLQALRREKLDLLVSIDYQTHYQKTFLARLRTPILVWVRDPWSPDDKRKLDTLRLPGRPEDRPAGLFYYDYRDFRRIWQLGKIVRRKVVFGTTSPPLGEKVEPTFSIRPKEVALLPNIVTLTPDGGPRHPRPAVLFLARLDPVKRPWLALELARRVPEAEFWLLGKNHFQGKPGGWDQGEPSSHPSNVRFFGHVGETEKRRLLSRAWVLLNTSIHEGLAVSFQEALACGVPLLSTVDMEDIAARFGIYVGAEPGDGLAAVPRLEAGLRALLADDSRREKLGEAGRAWVNGRHNATEFWKSFRRLAATAGVPLPEK
jgi:glycosyltransferase involved in cell wall biosynthesis